MRVERLGTAGSGGAGGAGLGIASVVREVGKVGWSARCGGGRVVLVGTVSWSGQLDARLSRARALLHEDSATSFKNLLTVVIFSCFFFTSGWLGKKAT